MDRAKLILALAVPLVLAFPARARDDAPRRHRHQEGWNPSVGRNAPQAIARGLAETHAGWLDAMANFYADPRIPNEEYFDDYRRPYGRREQRRTRR